MAGGVAAAVLAAVAVVAAVMLAGPGRGGPRIQPTAQAAEPGGGGAFVPHRGAAGTARVVPVKAAPGKRPAVYPTPLVRPPGNDSGVTLITAVSRPPVPGDVQPSAPPSPAASRAAGNLEVSPGSLDLGSARQGEITITASGGPVTWSAQTSGGQLTLSSAGGTVSAGHVTTLTVTVNQPGGVGGSAYVYVNQPGGVSQEVQVTWSGGSGGQPSPDPKPSPSPSSLPLPSPSQTSSPAPSPSASPSPSGSSGSSPPAPASASAGPSPRATPPSSSPAPRTTSPSPSQPPSTAPPSAAPSSTAPALPSGPSPTAPPSAAPSATAAAGRL